MSDLDVPESLTISLPTGRDGMLDRQCPIETCKRLFKIKLGTGLTGENLPLHCPYCGHASTQDQDFATDEQIDYAKQVAVQDVIGRVTDSPRAHGQGLQPALLGGLRIDNEPQVHAT